MALLFYECAKATDNLFRLVLCGPCTVAGLRPTYPDDPWFSDPDGGTEMIFLVPRMDVNYRAADGEPPQLDLAWMEKHVVGRGGAVRAYLPGVVPQFWCSTWNIIRKAEASSTGQLVLKVLPGHEDAISEVMDNLTDFKGRPIAVVRESQPIREHTDGDVEVDAVANARQNRREVPQAEAEQVPPPTAEQIDNRA